MPMGALAWTAWATTPANAPCSTQVSVAGFKGLWGAENQCPEAWPDGQKAGALPWCLQEVSAGLAAWWSTGGSFSPAPPIFSPGRACELLVDFCAPDLNPCQHEAQCVGTPDGPRSVLPISGAREGHGAPRHLPSALPSLFPCLSGALVSAV